MKSVARVLLGGAAAAALVEVAARVNIRQERGKRSHLGDRLYAEVVGSRGDPLVVLAGLQGSTRYWNHAFDDFAATRRVIYVDLLGFGRSPWPDVDYTLGDHLAYLRRTLVALDATRNVTFIAHSLGTIVAAHYAERHPDEIERLELLGTPVYAGEAEARRRIREMSPLAALFSLQPLLAREACLLMCALRPLLHRAAPRLMPGRPREVAEDSVMHSWESFRGAMFDILLRHPIARPLRTVGTKTVLVHGTRDPVTPLERIRALAEEVGATVRIVDADHHGYR